MNLDIPVITPPDGRKFVNETFETICSKQPSYSPFMDLPNQEFGYFGRKTNQRNDGSSDNDEVFSITGMELPRVLEILYFTKSYFRNVLVTIRNYPITLHDTTIKSQSYKIQKKLNQGKRGAKVRSIKKLITEKYGWGERADFDEGSCVPKKGSNLQWEKKDTQVLRYIFQQFFVVVANF